MENETQAEVQEVDLTKERMERCIPIAKEILKRIGEHDGLMGDESRDKMIESYTPLVETILKRYAETDLPLGDIEFVKQLTLQAYEFTFGMITASIDKSLEKLENKKFGKLLKNVTTKEIDQILKEDVS